LVNLMIYNKFIIGIDFGTLFALLYLDDKNVSSVVFNLVPCTSKSGN